MGLNLIRRGPRNLPATVESMSSGWVNVPAPSVYLGPGVFTAQATGCDGVRIYDWNNNMTYVEDTAGTAHHARMIVTTTAVVRVLNPTENTEVTIMSETIPPPYFVRLLRAWWGGRRGAKTGKHRPATVLRESRRRRMGYLDRAVVGDRILRWGESADYCAVCGYVDAGANVPRVHRAGELHGANHAVFSDRVASRANIQRGAGDTRVAAHAAGGVNGAKQSNAPGGHRAGKRVVRPQDGRPSGAAYQRPGCVRIGDVTRRVHSGGADVRSGVRAVYNECVYSPRRGDLDGGPHLAGVHRRGVRHRHLQNRLNLQGAGA